MEPYIGEIKLFAGDFAPRGWFFCDGTLLNIHQYHQLFTIIQTYYGGNGETNFALPDLRGRAPIQPGQGKDLSNFRLGETGGSETVILSQQQLPAHTHTMNINTVAPTVGLAKDAFLGFNANTETGDALPFYSGTATEGATLNAAAITPAGGSQPVKLRAPFLAINYIMAWEGIYPSRP